MRWFFKFFLFILIIAFALPFFMFGPNGGPLLKPPPAMQGITTTLKQWWSTTQTTVTKANPIQTITPSTPSQKNSGPVAYRWTDQYGRLHLTQTPPPTGVAFKKIAMDAPSRRVSSMPAPPPPPALGNETTTATKAPNATSFSLSDVYRPGTVDQLTNDAKNVEKLLQTRKERMDKMIDGQ
ncbi:DUF4124 domain-containing protein [Magnetococcales bacterium HHB-1]